MIIKTRGGLKLSETLSSTVFFKIKFWIFLKNLGIYLENVFTNKDFRYTRSLFEVGTWASKSSNEHEPLAMLSFIQDRGVKL